MAYELSGAFAQPAPQPTLRGKIANALSGFGAGFQGRGIEWQQQQQARQEQLSADRTQAMIKDAQVVYSLLEAQQPDKALQLVDNRIENIIRLGGDPSDTAAVRELIASGNVDAAKQEIGTLLSAAASAGLLQMEQPNIPAEAQTLMIRAQEAGLQPGTEEYQQFMMHGGPAPAPPAGDGLADQRERKIAQYQELFGMSRQDAMRAVDSQPMMDERGNLITFDPVTGRGRLVDVEMGTTQPVQTPPSGTSIEDLAFDPAKGTGFGATFIGLWNSTIGQAPLMPIGRNTAEAAQNLRILERDAIRALGSSGRPPVIEQERIASLLPKAMDPLQNPEEARYKMTNFVDLMMNQYTDDLRYSQDRRNPKEVRETSAERARAIESIVRRVLTPEAAQAMFDSINKIETEVGELQNMPIEKILELDPSQLTDAQLDIYIQRISK